MCFTNGLPTESRKDTSLGVSNLKKKTLSIQFQRKKYRKNIEKNQIPNVFLVILAQVHIENIITSFFWTSLSVESLLWRTFQNTNDLAKRNQTNLLHFQEEEKINEKFPILYYYRYNLARLNICTKK